VTKGDVPNLSHLSYGYLGNIKKISDKLGTSPFVTKEGTGQGGGSFFPSHHSLPIEKMEFDGTRTPVP